MKRALVSFRRPAIKIVLFLVLLSLALAVLALVLAGREDKGPASGPLLLSGRQINEIAEIRINNRYDSYSVYQEDGGFVIADLPMELVYADYLLMLLDEAARVEYIELIGSIDKTAGASPLSVYGLDPPLADAVIRYTNGESLTLLFGSEEKVSRGQYFMAEGKDLVYLMDHSRVVRFLQPLKRFLNFEIVPVRSVRSPLGTIKSLTLSGGAFPRPVAISEVDSESEEEMREALGFGATTHLVISPHLHKIDQKEAIDVFASLSGLLNIEVLDYNCGDAELDAYGFNNPLVKAEYVYLKGDGSDPVNIVLKTAMYQGDYILVRDDQRVVHRMEKKAFMATSYEKLVSRWFLTPFITDVRFVDIYSGGREHRVELSGEDNRSLEAALDGKKLDTGLFRKFYTLLVSASHDGLLLENPPPPGPPLLAAAFHYRDPLKKPDTMAFSPGSLRRLYVTVNGVTEFACLERYAQTVEAALSALAAGEDFSTDW